MKRALSIVGTVVSFLFCLSCTSGDQNHDMTVSRLSDCFESPPREFGPYVWWHWLGPDFSLSGIEKDLSAMKESGIAGATIFNVTSDVHEPLHGILNAPWPDQTYRSEAYWKALEHAAEVADESGLEIGIHNSPGYQATGGPWIDERRGIQKLVFSSVDVTGGGDVSVSLPRPELPMDHGWGNTATIATLYTDLAVMAVPAREDSSPKDVMDITEAMDENGNVNWNAPEGLWRLVRVGQAPSMARSHPLPEDLIGKELEADKMNREASQYHWDNMLGPLKEHLGKYIGKSFTHILVDSYETDWQNWTYGFREEFENSYGYDPLPYFAYSFCGGDAAVCERFNADMKEIVDRMYFENGWDIAKKTINEAGLEFYWEPYEGPFDVSRGAALADLPMGEFWTDTDGHIIPEIVEAARMNGKRIIGAEAFTGKSPESGYTEDPAFLKHTTDGAFVCGVNRLFLHHWTHQALDDRYKPGLSMGTWGTHFGRNQTWFEPGKEFFRYITRCQMLLQQGELLDIGEGFIHRSTTDADIFFVVNQSEAPLSRTVSCADISSRPELWDAYTGKIFDASRSAAECDDGISVTVVLQPAGSIFVVFDRSGDRKVPVESYFVPVRTESDVIDGTWNVLFKPAWGEPAFEIKDFQLSDFSCSDDERICYFAGTAVYSKNFTYESSDSADRVLLDLGEMNDICSVRINGRDAGVLWNPPYVGDVTDYLKCGGNHLEIAVCVNWANRLIGDERCEPDVEWHIKSPGEYPLTAFPDWLVNDTPRPSEGRKTFANYTYYTADSQLYKAGLEGPVRIVSEYSK